MTLYQSQNGIKLRPGKRSPSDPSLSENDRFIGRIIYRFLPRSSQGFVGGASDDIGVVERISVQLGGDEARHVSHVGQKERVVLFADFLEPLVVQNAGVSRKPYKFDVAASRKILTTENLN